MKAKKKMSPVMLAWMAAVIEVKGKIKRTDNPMRKTVQLVLYVRTRHFQHVQRLCDLTGVKVNIIPARALDVRNRRGCVEHCPEAHHHVTDNIVPTMATWAITGAGAAIILHNLLPYFVEVEGVEKIVDEVTEMLPKSGRGFSAIKATVDRLAALGWTIPDGLVPPEGDADEQVRQAA